MAVNRTMLRTRKKKAYACIQAGRFEEAQQLYASICRADPRDPEAWYLQGAVNGHLGNYDAAIECLGKATGLQPDSVDAHYNLAQACMHVDRVAEAAAEYRKVIALKPDHVDAHYNLGYALEQLDELQQALASYRKAIRLKPDYVEVYANLGNLINNLNQGSNEEGLKYLRLALRIDPGHTKSRVFLGKALHQNGRLEEALEQLDLVLQQDPGHIEAISARALTLEKRGDFDAALALLEPWLDSGDLSIANAFAAVAPHFDRSGEAIGLLEAALQQERLMLNSTRTLHFSLGKLLDRAGDYDGAFEHYRAGNASRQVDYKEAVTLKRLDSIRAAFNPECLAALPQATNRSPLPVFIVGMPRSGTTLTEQVLDSHPDVHGAGELTEIEDIANRLAARCGGKADYPHYLDRLTPGLLDEFAGAQLEKLAGRAPQALRVTDKMPHNFLYLGLIDRLFPGAHVIHCTRNPLDTCLSIYTYDFNLRHGYAADLASLGRYYQKYQALMDHWRQLLEIPMLEVSYEAMVADQEGMIRRLIDFCGLGWDERCLRFYENARHANTISYDQVRQPIYRKSVSRWRHYERQLAPLKQALGITD